MLENAQIITHLFNINHIPPQNQSDQFSLQKMLSRTNIYSSICEQREAHQNEQTHVLPSNVNVTFHCFEKTMLPFSAEGPRRC